MSSGNGETPAEAFDSGVTTGRALGAFFGMVAFNALLVVIALVLRRVTRPKGQPGGNPVELQNGKYNRKGINGEEDVEKGGGPRAEAPESAGSAERDRAARQAAEASPSGHHDNGAFVDVDLGDEATGRSDAVYEVPTKADGANRENEYSSLAGGDVTEKPEQPDVSEVYENFQGGRSVTERSEAGMFY